LSENTLIGLESNYEELLKYHENPKEVELSSEMGKVFQELANNGCKVVKSFKISS